MPHSGYVLRAMTLEDAERVAAVHVSVWREAYARLMPPDYLAALDVERFTENWRARLNEADTGGSHVVAVHSERGVVAFGSAGPARDPDAPAAWELWALNLLASEYGSGLADRLLTELVGQLDCCLWVASGNQRALAFYARHGFRSEGRTKVHPPTGVLETRLVRSAAHRRPAGPGTTP